MSLSFPLVPASNCSLVPVPKGPSGPLTLGFSWDVVASKLCGLERHPRCPLLLDHRALLTCFPSTSLPEQKHPHKLPASLTGTSFSACWGITGSVPGPSHEEAGLPGQGEALGVWLVLKRLRVGVQPGLSSTWNRALCPAPAPLKLRSQSPQHLGASPATSGLFQQAKTAPD